jgi:hypothetical protein
MARQKNIAEIRRKNMGKEASLPVAAASFIIINSIFNSNIPSPINSFDCHSHFPVPTHPFIPGSRRIWVQPVGGMNFLMFFCLAQILREVANQKGPN